MVKILPVVPVFNWFSFLLGPLRFVLKAFGCGLADEEVVLGGFTQLCLRVCRGVVYEKCRINKVCCPGFLRYCGVIFAWCRWAPPCGIIVFFFLTQTHILLLVHPRRCKKKKQKKRYIHLWPVDVMRLERARASPRAVIPVPISLCILCSLCAAVCLYVWGCVTLSGL